MGAIASQITSLTIVHSTFYSDADQRKHKISASLVFVRGIHPGPLNSPHKWPEKRGKCFHLMTSSWKSIYSWCPKWCPTTTVFLGTTGMWYTKSPSNYYKEIISFLMSKLSIAFCLQHQNMMYKYHLNYHTEVIFSWCRNNCSRVVGNIRIWYKNMLWITRQKSYSFLLSKQSTAFVLPVSVCMWYTKYLWMITQKFIWFLIFKQWSTFS